MPAMHARHAAFARIKSSSSGEILVADAERQNVMALDPRFLSPLSGFRISGVPTALAASRDALPARKGIASFWSRGYIYFPHNNKRLPLFSKALSCFFTVSSVVLQ